VFKKILVPLDGSRRAEQSLPVACSLAQAYQAEVRLISVEEVIDPLNPGDWQAEPEAPHSSSSRLHYLSRQVKAVEEQGLKVSHAILPIGSPAQLILEEAQATQADLIVVTSHGRSGLSRLVLGSVSEYLARHAPCPVMVLRQPAPPQ